MNIPLQIHFRDMVPLAGLEAEIRRRAERLGPWTREVTRCEVTVESQDSRHRQGHEYRVKLHVRVPDGEFSAGGRQGHEDPVVAMHEAFAALERQIEDWERRRRDAKRGPTA